jgi:Asp/Glu/hydantoin racemase
MERVPFDRKWTRILVINPNSSKAMTDRMERATLVGVSTHYPYISEVCPSKPWMAQRH